MIQVEPFWMDAPTLCKYASIHHNTIDNWIKLEGFPPGRMRGGKRFWKRPEVDAWMEGGSARVDELTLAQKVHHAAKRALDAG